MEVKENLIRPPFFSIFLRLGGAALVVGVLAALMVGWLVGSESSFKKLAGDGSPASQNTTIEVVTHDVGPVAGFMRARENVVELWSTQIEQCISSEPINDLQREKCAARMNLLWSSTPWVVTPYLLMFFFVFFRARKIRKFWTSARDCMKQLSYEGSWEVRAVERYRPGVARFDWMGWSLGLIGYRVTLAGKAPGLMYLPTRLPAPEVGEVWSLFQPEVVGSKRRYLGVRRNPQAELDQARRRKVAKAPD